MASWMCERRCVVSDEVVFNVKVLESVYQLNETSLKRRQINNFSYLAWLTATAANMERAVCSGKSIPKIYALILKRT